MSQLDREIIGAMFRAAEAAVDIIHGAGDHADLRQIVEYYERTREIYPATVVELNERWGAV